MTKILADSEMQATCLIMAISIGLMYAPSPALNIIGSLALLMLLPGLQLSRWLGLNPSWRTPETVCLSLALGFVTTPIIIYWASLLFGYSRPMLLMLLPLYSLGLAIAASLQTKPMGDDLASPLHDNGVQLKELALSPSQREKEFASPPKGRAVKPQNQRNIWSATALAVASFWRQLNLSHSKTVELNSPTFQQGGRDSANLTASLPLEKTETLSDQQHSPRWLMLAVMLTIITASGVFLAYFELETPAGYYPVQMEDWQKHYGVAFALRETGIPPTSFFFYGMNPHDTLTYYYFLHLNGATVDLLSSGPSSLHNSFVIIIVLASMLFSGTLFFLARRLFNQSSAAFWSLACGTLIGGLDIIPILQRTIITYRQNFPDTPLPLDLFIPRDHIDNWISALSLRLNGFYAHHVWVPQHLTGLTIICLGCYLYLTVKQRRRLLFIYPLLLFSLLGHSTWIALIVALSLFMFALWHILMTYRQSGQLHAAWQLFGAYATIATAAIVIALPFILTLVGPHAPKSGIVFEIPKLDGWWLMHPMQAIAGPTWLTQLADLPLHFFIEYGVVLMLGLAGFMGFWRKSSSAETAAQTLIPFFGLLLLIGLLTVSFFASGRGWRELDPNLILNNDLGLRAMMPGQLVLALFAGYGLPRFLSWLSSLHRYRLKTVGLGLLGLLIVLGLSSSMWEFVAMGLTKYRAAPQLSPTVYQTLRDLPTVTPPTDDKPFPVVQHRIHRQASRFQLSLGQRPIGFSTGEAIVFHPQVRQLALAHELSQQAFDNGLPVWSYQHFQNLGADYIFVGPAEREAMRHPEKYQHRQYFQPVYQNGQTRIYRVQPWSSTDALAMFDEGRIEFNGYLIDQTPFYPGQAEALPAADARGLVTAWRLTAPTTKDYTVFIHFVDGSGEIVAQADHQLWAWSRQSEGPTSTWTDGLLAFDSYPLPATVLSASSPLSIRLGLWLPDTGEQFPVSHAELPLDEQGRVILGEGGRLP